VNVPNNTNHTHKNDSAGEGEVIYNRLTVLRAERKISRRQLADALGIHYQTVGYLERGEFNPSLQLALRIAEYFGVPMERVFSIKPF
jgi:DNA-binding XRE family transcriptional regulator